MKRYRLNDKVFFLAAILAVGLTAIGCGPEKRAERTYEELVAARKANDSAKVESRRALFEGFIKLLESKIETAKGSGGTTPPTVDILIISGGGDWGAFGAGVLKGWGSVQGEMARPRRFDVVTGVSTGALIAPFAFLGDDESYNRVVQLYRAPKEDWVKGRGLIYFLPNNPSFFALPGLEREVHETLDRPLLERIAAEEPTGRALLVNTTNIDFGDMQVWDIIKETKTALVANDIGHVHAILMASAGIPAVFPARSIGEYLYVDGAITGNILYGGRATKDDTVFAMWRAKHPGVPMPRLRYWVIFNNQLRFPTQVTPLRWMDIMNRATIMATQTSTVNSMRHLYALSEISRIKNGQDIEVRVMAVPEDFVPAEAGSFKKEVMNTLADIGERMGADPTSWGTESP